MILLMTSTLFLQVVSITSIMVYAERVEEPVNAAVEEQKPLELPTIKDFLNEEESSEPSFAFPQLHMQGIVEEVLKVTFFSDQEVSEAHVTVPKEAKLLKEQLPAGILVEQGEQACEWIIQADHAQNTFVLPLVFDTAGNYELSVEETTAYLEINEQEGPIEEVPTEETESSDEELAGQEDLEEKDDVIDEDHDNEQQAEAPQEQQSDEEETDEASQVIEPTVFDGETAEVTTMAQFREAVANPGIGIISVQANLTETVANILTVDRPILIQGNGYALTFGSNGFYFQLEEVIQASTLRIENATLTKVGVTPLINATVESSKNWTVELEDITEVNTNNMRLASLPEGSIHFTGGVSNFTSTASAQTFIEAKEVLTTNQAEVTISRGNATVFFSSAAVSNPKFMVEEGATVTIVTTAGVANTIDLRGESPELVLQSSGQLDVTTIGMSSVPTNTTNNVITLIGTTPKITLDSESRLTVTASRGARGIYLAGAEALMTVNDSELTVNSEEQSAVHLNGSNPKVTFNDSKISLETTTGIGLFIEGNSLELDFVGSETVTELTSISGENLKIIGSLFEINITNSAKVNTITDNGSSVFISDKNTSNDQSSFNISNGGELNVLSNSGSALSDTAFLISSRDPIELIIDGGILNVQKNGGAAAAIATTQDDNSFQVKNGGQLIVHNVGTGTPRDAANQGILFAQRSWEPKGNSISVTDPGSKVQIIADNGPAIQLGGGDSFSISNLGYFDAHGNTATSTEGIITTRGTLTNTTNNLNITFDNPLFMNFQNNRTNGGNLFTVNSDATIIATNSDLAVWKNGVDLNDEPSLNFQKINYSFSGTNFNTLGETNVPDQLNTDIFGTAGLTSYSRLSSNNGRWAIADELRVPTNADTKIHGHVSLPVGLDDSRPAWEDEVTVTVEVELPSGEKQDYTTKTKGHSNDSPGISIYGEEPRGGLFEIDLKEPLQVGAKIRISHVELTNGDLTDGFENQILTDTLEVFPIVPPIPAQFTSTVIAQNSKTIQGVTENTDVEVTATHNGQSIDTSNVSIDNDGKFTLDLSTIFLEEDDEIQVFLRDAEGSAKAAGVINPPETNNDQGNINPATELIFHDVIFESATTLIVGDVGPASPVDPLDPEVEVDPENKPEIPEDQGLLSIDFVSQFDFGKQGISVKDQTYYAQPQRLLNEDGTVNEEEKRPNYVQISDRRSEDNRYGWQLSVTQNHQFINSMGQELTGANISFRNQQLVTAQVGDTPELQQTNPMILLPNTKRILLMAQGNEGTGTWIYRFGDAQTADKSIALHVPGGTNPESTSFSTTLTWELSAVPGN